MIHATEEIGRQRQHRDEQRQIATDGESAEAELDPFADPGTKVGLLEQLGQVGLTSRVVKVGDENRKDGYVLADSKVPVRCFCTAVFEDVAYDPVPMALKPALL